MMNTGMLNPQNMMNAGGAYGAGKAGSAFDVMTFIRRPSVILRIVSILFAIIVFACISSEGYMTMENKEEKCIINESGACGWTVGIGVLGFLGAVALLVLEARFEQISSIKIRRRAVIAELGFTALWTFLWFITFCYLVDQWSKTESEEIPAGYGTTNAQAAAAFSFFSIFVWGALGYLSYLKYKQGAANAFAPSGFEGDMAGGMPRGGYSSYPGAPDDRYQEPPFSSPGQKDAHGFQSPAY
ncbi:synaptogyrin-2-like [Paramacrobiotus metropolitanus]|uniref:synaptogyrin-2-like n=1 Tax=Paramacrobiotus metropolitanus TaxID=2943436 RepID=UPI002445BF23|nr:synaptogyrin-2-like [Paramacrobiotus metropolitanus]XP_055339996.1 synaptogyrin-2-like [Paramacrobiotus metropolitanus]XP_055339997.1 synaptogyrin-2-like [Paramacrobiotus metropolitanus]